MEVVKNTAEAFAYGMMVASLLDTFRMVVGALATISAYKVMVGSGWGRFTSKMEGEEKEAHSTRLMALRSNMTKE